MVGFGHNFEFLFIINANFLAKHIFFMYIFTPRLFFWVQLKITSTVEMYIKYENREILGIYRTTSETIFITHISYYPFYFLFIISHGMKLWIFQIDYEFLSWWEITLWNFLNWYRISWNNQWIPWIKFLSNNRTRI